MTTPSGNPPLEGEILLPDPPQDPAWPKLAAQALTFLPAAGRMVYATLRDDRVPSSAKIQAGACLGLLAVPLEAIPLVGEIEMVGVLSLAIGRLVAGAGEDIMREHWQGSEAGFKLFMLLSTFGLKPRKALAQFFLTRAGLSKKP